MVAGREERARFVGRIGEPRGIAHLGQLIDQDAVRGQRGANGLEVGDLRRERIADLLGGLSLGLGDMVGAAVALGVVAAEAIG